MPPTVCLPPEPQERPARIPANVLAAFSARAPAAPDLVLESVRRLGVIQTEAQAR